MPDRQTTRLYALVITPSIVLVLVLLFLASYSWGTLHRLHIPVSPGYSIIGLLVPVLTFFGLLIPLQRNHQTTNSNSVRSLFTLKHPHSLHLTLSAGLLAIIDAVVLTLSGTYMDSETRACRHNNRWQHMFRAKDGGAIRAIQNAFDCCGFNSVVDRAFPFPRKGIEATDCTTRYERHTSCVGAWAQEERMATGMVIAVAVISLLAKAGVFIAAQRRTRQGFAEEQEQRIQDAAEEAAVNVVGRIEDIRREEEERVPEDAHERTRLLPALPAEQPRYDADEQQGHGWDEGVRIGDGERREGR